MRVKNYKIYFFSGLLFFFSFLGNSMKPINSIDPDKPNILWIIIEDMSPDLGCYGHDLVKTPHIDRLADQGIRYDNVFATGAACSPSRTAFVTGYYQNTLGAYHMRYPEELKPTLPDSVTPVHILMKELGYQTANIRSFPGNGKTDWLFQYNPDSYDTNHWEELANSRISASPPKPFFARINVRLTHRPFESDEVNPINPNEVKVPPYYPDHPVAQADFAAYYESIQVMDRQVGQILSDLQKHQLDKNTIIFFFSDHGRPMTRAKNYLYDSGIEVPLLISTLDEDLRTRMGLEGQNESLFSLIDITATSLELAGGRYDTQGISILEHPEGREFLWAAADRMGEIHFKSRMIRTAKFKYIRNYRHDFSINSASTAHRKSTHPIYHLLNVMHANGDLDEHQTRLVEPMAPEELYDVVQDPFELNNLATVDHYQDILEDLKGRLETYSVEIKDQGLGEDSKIIENAFDEYGKSSLEKNKFRILELQEKVEEQVNKRQN